MKDITITGPTTTEHGNKTFKRDLKKEEYFTKTLRQSCFIPEAQEPVHSANLRDKILQEVADYTDLMVDNGLTKEAVDFAVNLMEAAEFPKKFGAIMANLRSIGCSGITVSEEFFFNSFPECVSQPLGEERTLHTFTLEDLTFGCITETSGTTN